MHTEINPSAAFAAYFQDRQLKPYIELLAEQMAAGNVCLELSDMDGQIVLERCIDSELCGEPGQLKPFILDGQRLYLQRYFNYESNFISDIKGLCAADVKDAMGLAFSQQKLIRQLLPASNLQSIAALAAFTNRLQIITGGPGTGKTTSITKFLALELSLNETCKIMLAAPTGKAAARMKESLQNVELILSRENIEVDTLIIEKIKLLEATTIHRLLGYMRDSIYFQQNNNNPLHADVIIVDECSMIDIALFSKLLSAIGQHAKLILLGDKNQLASVEAGSVFGDLCTVVSAQNHFTKEYIEFYKIFFPDFIFPNTQNDEIFSPLQNQLIELQESHRFAIDSEIGRLSSLILNGDANAVEKYYLNEAINNYVKWKTVFEVKYIESFANYFIELIDELDVIKALKLINKAKILCAVREGRSGVNQINQVVEKYLSTVGKIDASSEYYDNRMIMITQNQPELDIYNGDLGLIRKIDGKKKACLLKANGEIQFLSPALIKGMETAWAMTIHKSQGSEFDHIQMILPGEKENPLLNRELIYTAITRARFTVEIISNIEVLKTAIHHTAKRISGIQTRLKNMEWE